MTPLGNQVNPPDPQKGFALMSSALGIQQQRQALAGQAADVQMRQLEARKAQSTQDFFSDWDPTEHMSSDGTTDTESARQSAAYKKAGNAKPDIDLKLAQIKQSQLQNKMSLTSLNGSNLTQFGQVAQSLAQDPDVIADKTDPVTGVNAGRAKVDAALTNFSKLGPDAARVAQIYSPITQHAPPGKLAHGVRSLALQGQDIAGQQGQTNPQTVSVDAGPAIAYGTVDKTTGTPNFSGPVVQKGIAPSVTQTPTGQLARVGGNGSTLTPLETVPGAGGQPQPNLNQSTAQVETGRGLARGVTDRVSQVQAQANNTVQAQDALNRAKAIIESGEGPNTGTGFEAKKGLKNIMAGLGIDTQGADDMNTLTKNLARFEAARATASGLGGTDAARELSHNGSPNTQLDGKALQGIVRQSLATERALAGYARLQSKTSDPQQLLENEAKFRDIPHSIETIEYTMSRDKNEAERFLREHGLSHADVARSAKALKELGIM